MRHRLSFIFILSLTIFIYFSNNETLKGQSAEINLNNPSFEDIPHKGGNEFDLGIRGWYDCGRLTFPSETPPDIHPINAWEVTMMPTDGKTYLGMVVRDVDSWESVSQRLAVPLEGGKCYSFNIELARSDKYISGSRNTMLEENYTQPAVLRIWGGNGICGKQVLLGESVKVENREWRTYEFEFRPERTVNYFTLEAFYKVPTLMPYNGHLLLDNASDIVEIPCDDTIELETEAEVVAHTEAPKKRTPKKTTPTPTSEPLAEDYKVITPPPVIEEPKNETVPSISTLIPELQGNDFYKGQIIRINSIYFGEDTYRINEKSADALDQVYQFLKRNTDIVIEVGGHSSTGPPTHYCDTLSANRAKEVAQYIAQKGISTKRLSYKGYGKRKPVIPNDRNNLEAKRKNQRVEIKILKTSSSNG